MKSAFDPGAGPRGGERSDPAGHATLSKAERQAIFKNMVAQELEKGLLRYTRRQHLLRYATMLEFSPFEAHLLIAEAQYEAGHLRPPRFDSTVTISGMSRPDEWPAWFKVSFALIVAAILDLLIIRFVLT